MKKPNFNQNLYNELTEGYVNKQLIQYNNFQMLPAQRESSDGLVKFVYRFVD
jgi:hypothetical protein